MLAGKCENTNVFEELFCINYVIQAWANADADRVRWGALNLWSAPDFS